MSVKACKTENPASWRGRLSMPMWEHLVCRNMKSEQARGKVGELAVDFAWLGPESEMPYWSIVLKKDSQRLRDIVSRARVY